MATFSLKAISLGRGFRGAPLLSRLVTNTQVKFIPYSLQILMS